MSSEATCPITLSVAGDPRLARLDFVFLIRQVMIFRLVAVLLLI